MREEGHFGVREAKINKHALRARAKKWGTFFVKPDMNLYTVTEQNDRIWNSKNTVDVLGAQNIV